MPRDESYVNIEHLATIRIFASPDQQILVGQLWKKQTAIMVFLRHFACIACRAHAAQVWNDRTKYESSGAKIVFIGNGQPNWIEKFREDLGIDKGIILTDPSLTSFKAAGFKNGFFTLLQPASVAGVIKLAKDGNVQKPYSDDAGTHWQMGGILAINTSGKVLYRYASKALGDFPREPHLEIIKQDEAADVKF